MDDSIVDNLIEVVWLSVENDEAKFCLLDSILSSIKSDLVVRVVSLLIARAKETPESVELKKTVSLESLS